MFCFSVMESPFCFANAEFVTVPATSFIDDLGPLRSVQLTFVRKIGFYENSDLYSYFSLISSQQNA